MLGRLKEITALNQILGKRRDRVILSAAMGFALNLAYVLYHGIIGIYFDSIWFLLTGAGVSILTAVFGIYMILKKERK